MREVNAERLSAYDDTVTEEDDVDSFPVTNHSLKDGVASNKNGDGKLS